MRDIIIFLIVVGALPFILRRAYVGVLLWSWLGYMNPHRLSWGFAYDFPFAQLTAIATLIALPFDKSRRGIPVQSVTVVWFLLIVWMNLTTLFAMNPEDAFQEWDRTMKIMLISVVTIVLMQSRERLNALITVIVISLGFYGLKGGLFAVLTGGQYLTWGPPDSFIGDNNSLALALIMILPLMRYLQMQASSKNVKRILAAAMVLTAFAILASRSRGALLAGGSMVFYLWLKGRHKLTFGLILAAILPVIILSMPEKWFERMTTITEYQEDDSAMGRINAWWFAFNLAKDRPLVGGGFDAFTPEAFERYAPDPLDFHDSHSIYFEMLGEHGFVGLGLFLVLGWLALRRGTWITRRARDNPELSWARDLAAMLQVSLISYAVGGAFLGLAYFDLYYHLVAAMVILQRLVAESLSRPADLPVEEPSPAQASVRQTRAYIGHST